MPGAGRPRGISVGLEGLAALALFVVADREIARDQINLFPIFVHERLGREDAGLEAQQPRARALLVFFVERTREDLLLNARGITGQRLPAARHVDGVKFLVFLVDGHPVVPSLIEIAEIKASPAVQNLGFRRWCVGGRRTRELAIASFEEYERPAPGEGMFVHGLDPADEDL